MALCLGTTWRFSSRFPAVRGGGRGAEFSPVQSESVGLGLPPAEYLVRTARVGKQQLDVLLESITGLGDAISYGVHIPMEKGAHESGIVPDVIHHDEVQHEFRKLAGIKIGRQPLKYRAVETALQKGILGYLKMGSQLFKGAAARREFAR